MVLGRPVAAPTMAWMRMTVTVAPRGPIVIGARRLLARSAPPDAVVGLSPAPTEGGGRDRPRTVVATVAAADPGPMMTARTAGSALFGAFVGAWIGRAIFVWILDASRTWEIVGMVTLGVVGLLLCLAGALEERQ